MAECDECGNHDLRAVEIEGYAVFECGLCLAISGDEDTIQLVLQRREAHELGIEPEVYALQQALDKIRGLRVKQAEVGDVDACLWPYVTLVARDEAFLIGLENLLKSTALGASSHEVHWIVEVEYQGDMTYTLKPRFHRDVQSIGPDQVRAAQRDLARLARDLERNRFLSWWRA